MTKIIQKQPIKKSSDLALTVGMSSFEIWAFQFYSTCNNSSFSFVGVCNRCHWHVTKVVKEGMKCKISNLYLATNGRRCPAPSATFVKASGHGKRFLGSNSAARTHLSDSSSFNKKKTTMTSSFVLTRKVTQSKHIKLWQPRRFPPLGRHTS